MNSLLDLCLVKYRTDWLDRKKIYIPMDFESNPDQAQDSKFNVLNDFAFIFLYARFRYELSLPDLFSQLKSPQCISHCQGILDNTLLTNAEREEAFET